MAISRGESYARARTLYYRPLNPRRTQEMRSLLATSQTEVSLLQATTKVCDYLNRWNNAGSAEVAEAEAAVQQALAANPDYFLAHYAQGFIHRTRGEHPEALAAFDETIRRAPDFSRAHAQRGEQLVYLGRAADGIAEVHKALTINPRSSARGMYFWIIGRAHFFLEEDEEATRWLRRSIALWPNLWYSRFYRIAAFAMQGKTGVARRMLQALETPDGAFAGFTLTRIAANERITPSDHPVVIQGRERFHEGLRRAGMNP